MSNQQLIKSAHIWGLAVLLACGLWTFSGTDLKGQEQNQNQNSNSNTSNANTMQNKNSNMRANRSEAFAMHLAEGTHQFSYTARATTPIFASGCLSLWSVSDDAIGKTSCGIRKKPGNDVSRSCSLPVKRVSS